MKSLDKKRLEELLKDAKQAHAEYEKQLGKPDENWEKWYAEYIIDTLEK